MAKTRILGILAFGFVVGGAWGLALTFGSVTQAVQTSVPMTVKVLQAEIEQTAKNELANGCMETDEHGRTLFCGSSKEKMEALHTQIMTAIRAGKIRSADQVAVVENNIKTMTENPSLDLRFDTAVSNPYTEKSDVKVEYYKDAQDTMYMVNPATNKVLAFTYNKLFQVPAGQKLSIEELRSRADDYLTKHVEDFDQVKKEYTFEESSKGDVYAFRYSAPEKVNGEGMLPFVQVKLSAAGELVGFSDIRSLFK
jgi:hypothetical protein